MTSQAERRAAIRGAARRVIAAERRALEPAQIYDLLAEPLRKELKLSRRRMARQLSADDGLIHRPDGRWTVEVGELWEVAASPDPKRPDATALRRRPLRGIETDVFLMVERYGAQNVADLYAALAPAVSCDEFLAYLAKKARLRADQGFALKAGILFRRWGVRVIADPLTCAPRAG
jgi:hypothetical protein